MLNPSKPGRSSGAVSLAVLLAVGVIVQIQFVSRLWGHTSTDGAVLGRYSARYALALALSTAVMLGWVIAWFRRGPFLRWVTGVPGWLRWAGIGLATALATAIPFTSIEGVLKSFTAANGLLVALILLRSLPDRPVSFRRWPYSLLAAAAIMLLPALIAVLSDRRFSPDEADWAVRSVGPFVSEGLYERNWLEVPVTITPGRGWSSALYGWLLHNVSYDLMVGRAFNFAGYVLAFAGIWLVSARLFGRTAAAVSTALAVASPGILNVLDYRADHQLPAGAMLATWAAFQARYRQGRTGRALWHAACGLLAVLSLQIHGAGIAFVAGFSAFYLAEFALESIRGRRWASPEPLIWYGLGAAVGAASYYAFNIAPVGGVQAYLEHLSDRRGERWKDAWTVFRTPGSLIVRPLAWGALAYLLWRREWADRRFVGLFACVAIAGTILDTQGYFTIYNAFYLVPIGALIVDGWASASIPRGQNLHAAATAAIVALVFGGALWFQLRPASVTDWLRTGRFPPYLYEALGDELQAEVTDDDVIVSTPLLTWSLPEHPHLLSIQAEATAMGLWNVSGLEVWERVGPTLAVDVQPETGFPSGLQAYMQHYEFGVCRTFRVMGHRVLLYRAGCPASDESG